MRPALIASLALSLSLTTGCSLTPTATPSSVQGAAVQGVVHGGQQPVVGSHVYLFAANTSGYGAASVSLLNAVSTGHSDTVGAYVLTDANGGFALTGDYTCTPNQQVYLLSLGGDPGAGANSAVGLMAVLGTCPAAANFSALPFIYVNEITTVATAYSIAGFAVDATHVADDENVGGNTTSAAAVTGMANAFANANNLVSTFTGGNPRSVTPAGNGTVPEQELYTLGNILAACVNSTGPGSTQCGTLFSNASSNGSTGTLPTDTATAAINIAHNPGANVATLFNLQGTTPPFGNKLANAPNDFTVALAYTGGGLANQQQLAIDGSGNAWITNQDNASVSKFSPLGAALSPTGGFTAGGNINHPQGLAFDPATGNAWIASTYNNSLVVLSPAGAYLASYTSGGISSPYQVKFDPSGNVWAVNNYQSSSVTEMNTSGTSLSGATGYDIGDYEPGSLAIDPGGNVFVLNGGGGNIKKVSNGGSLLGTYAYATNGNAPFDIALDAGSNVWTCTYGGYLTELSNTGTALSGNGFTGGGLNYAFSLAFDGANNIWVANRSNDISEFTDAGVAITPSTGYISNQLNAPKYIAVDGSGNVWVANNYDAQRVSEFIGAAAPAVVPYGLATATAKIGARP